MLEGGEIGSVVDRRGDVMKEVGERIARASI